MAEGRLYIGNRRYSSWSMRGWLAVKLAGLDVEEVMIHFSRPGPTEAITKLSPNGLVPYLEHRGARVWESLAVCEYCAEITPSLWPADPIARAHARAISAEMHAGFTGIAAVDVDESRARFLGAWSHAGGAGRHCPHRGDVGGHATALRCRWTVPVRRRVHRGRCDVCAGGDAVPHLAAGNRRRDASLLRQRCARIRW